MIDVSAIRQPLTRGLSILLCLFILSEVNYPLLAPQSQLAIFALLGLVLVFLRPAASALQDGFNWLLILLTVGCFGYVLIQSEPLFSTFWIEGQVLGDRAGMERPLDELIGLLGLLLVLEATRRTIGLTLPLLAISFIAYAAWGPLLPDWLFPHRGYDWPRIVSQTFLHSQGVFGIALKVMFTYVFLFVLFGTLLEQTGATDTIINFARRLFRGSVGGPAKVAVISSGLMGSLSGSAVANTATTGTFTIPLMRSSGFKPHAAGGIEAAASSGGALVPPIMGAGAYMMLEIVEPAVTFLEIIRAALIPALLYYFALLVMVHFYARRIGASAEGAAETAQSSTNSYSGWLFAAAFFSLIAFLVIGYTPFRAVTLSLILIMLMSLFRPETRVSPGKLSQAMVKAATAGIPLIAAAACVGIIIGVVTLTGVGAKLPGAILPLAENNLILALVLLMVSTIILGMGLPSAVCYLLMATLVGPVLTELGVVPLSAHLFIFYFGMMSMVTPPVALAAYTAAAIAGSGIMRTGVTAFRFALTGFALPYLFVIRPELLLLDGQFHAGTLIAILVALCGSVLLAASVAGFVFKPLQLWERLLIFASAMTFFFADADRNSWIWYAAALVVALLIGFRSRRSAALGS